MLTYLLLLFFAALFRVLPYRVCVAVSVVLARLAFHVVRWRRAEAERRIMSVTGMPRKEARRVAYLSLRNCFLTIAEILHTRTLSQAWIDRHVAGADESASALLALLRPAGDGAKEVETAPSASSSGSAGGPPATRKSVGDDGSLSSQARNHDGESEAGEPPALRHQASPAAPSPISYPLSPISYLERGASGVVLALPHMGNWYLAGNIMALKGVPICAVAGRQRNWRTNAWMNTHLYKGMTVFERGSSAIRECIKALRSGTAMAILPDVRMKTPDLKIPFLGGVANIGRGMAAFARKTGSPVVIARIRRVGCTHHAFAVSEPIYPNLSLPAEEDITRITTAVLSEIDAWIHAEPAQWFWYNKRWVLDPV